MKNVIVAGNYSYLTQMKQVLPFIIPTWFRSWTSSIAWRCKSRCAWTTKINQSINQLKPKDASFKSSNHYLMSGFFRGLLINGYFYNQRPPAKDPPRISTVIHVLSTSNNLSLTVHIKIIQKVRNLSPTAWNDSCSCL